MIALDPLPMMNIAVDPRADGATRSVHVEASRVTIERVVQGIRMRIAVPVAAYRGLFLAVREPSETATLTLRHDDPELDVSLGSGDAMDLARQAQAWRAMLGHEVAIEAASVIMRGPIGRRTKRPPPGRRSAFARRRGLGDTTRLASSFASEHEIIARD